MTDSKTRPLSQPDTLRAIGLMVFAMAAFALGDAAMKGASSTLPPGQIIAMVGFGGTSVFALLCRRQNSAIWDRRFAHPAVLLRNGGEIVAASCFVTALSLVPMSLAVAIFQSTPIFVVIGAALILGERVGPWRWGAVVVGLFGMLLIIRPGLGGFDAKALWAAGAVLGMAVRDLSTRSVPHDLGNFQLATWAFGAITLAGLLLVWVFGGAVWPEPVVWALMVAATAGIVLGYGAITASLRMGEVSAVMPYRYSRILFALILSIGLFSERPDITTLSGAAILVLAGLVTLWREGRSAAH